jgi:hypothetical protein
LVDSISEWSGIVELEWKSRTRSRSLVLERDSRTEVRIHKSDKLPKDDRNPLESRLYLSHVPDSRREFDSRKTVDIESLDLGGSWNEREGDWVDDCPPGAACDADRERSGRGRCESTKRRERRDADLGKVVLAFGDNRREWYRWSGGGFNPLRALQSVHDGRRSLNRRILGEERSKREP